MKKEIWIPLILITILVILLILLIVKSYSDKVSPWPSSNVNAVKNSCASDCLKNDSYNYCDIKRVVDDRINLKFSDTCYNLANSDNYSHRGYDIPKCPQIDC